VGERRGLTVTGAVGGLVSSTAVTMAMADRSKESDAVAGPAAAATVLASTIMAARVAFFAGAVDRAILPRLLPVVAAMLAVGMLAAWLVARHRAGEESGAAGDRIRNPFSLREALAWAAVYGGILFVSKAASVYLSTGALFLVAAVSALADVDAVTIAYTKLASGTQLWRETVGAITVAVVMNTLVKLGIGWVRGSAPFRRLVAVALGAMAAVGAVAGALVYARV
jgi:uncharacterized membrane protein (DUF4010 family)